MTAYNKVNGDYAGGQPGPPPGDPQGRVGLPGLGHVRLGRHAHLGLRAGGARPGVGRADRRDDVGRRVLHRAAARRRSRRASCPRSACRRWCGASCARCTRSASIAWEPGRPAPADDAAAHHEIALDGARQGIVLLENDGILPLAADTTARIAVVGGYAQLGRAGRHRLERGRAAGRLRRRGARSAAPGSWAATRNLYLLPSSPMQELRQAAARGARSSSTPGMTPAEAALLARRSDVVIVFGIRVEGEGFDLPDLSLPWGQDAVIEAVAVGEPEHDRRARDRQPGRHAVARQGPRDRPGVVPRPGRRPGDRRGPDRRDQPVGPAAGHLPGRPGPDPAPRAPRPGDAVGHAHHHRLRRGRRGRLPLVRAAGRRRRSTPSATA